MLEGKNGDGGRKEGNPYIYETVLGKIIIMEKKSKIIKIR